MRRVLLFTAAGLFAALGLPSAAGARDSVVAKKPAPTSCGDHGTAVKFFKGPSEAARAALKEEKLVFVLHISGLFEDPDFT